MVKRWIDILLNLFLVLAGLVVLWVFVQVFLLASFRIPSDSMEPELTEGDFVAVWKPTLGARLFDLNAAGTDRDTPHAGIPESKAGRCAGLQLPASQRLGQGRDAHLEILHQTVYRIAGRHAFHTKREVPDKRDGGTARKHGLAGTDRADVAGRVPGRCL